jgi:hypothetical protein
MLIQSECFPSHRVSRDCLNNTAFLPQYIVLSFFQSLNLLYDKEADFECSAFQQAHTHLLQLNGAFHMDRRYQPVNKGRMLHAEAICCFLHTFLHMSYKAHHRSMSAFPPLSSSIQKPYCFAFVDRMSKNVTLRPLMICSSPSATVIKCRRSSIKRVSFF